MNRFLPLLAVIVSSGLSISYGEENRRLPEVDLEVKATALLGMDVPAMRIVALEDLKNVQLSINSCKGKKRLIKVGNLPKGETREYQLDHAPGRCLWHIEVRCKGTDGVKYFDFETAIARPMQITINKEDVDLAEGKIRFIASEPVARVVLTIFGEGGRKLLDADMVMESDAGNITSVRFPPQNETVTLVKLTVYDPLGFYNGVEITPFFIEIPHEEVAFEFGKAEILHSEEEKLERTLQNIQDALKRFGNEFKARLYVAGYTDTVGTKEYNQDLSERRAHAIASWFKSHGLHIQVCSQGFGEDALLVPTPDETPEPKNRRTVHVLANQHPPISAVFPRADWRCF